MAKGFPYFKFFSSEWLTGDIVYEDLELQGLFINICAIYWQRDGKLSIDDINNRYKKSELLAKLTDRFFSVTDGFISIKFLDEQLVEAGHISKVNSENGSKGGRPKASKTLKKKPTANRPLSDYKAKKSKEEEELEEEKNNNIPTEVEFVEYGYSLLVKVGKPPLPYKPSLILKYQSWLENDWSINRNGKLQPIKNWKSTLANTIKYLVPETNTNNSVNLSYANG